MAVLLTPPYLQFFDNNGDPLSGGLIYTYAAGTLTPKATYTDSSESTPMSNPVVLDSAGRTTIWISGSYYIDVRDSLGNVIDNTDNITAFNVASSSINSLLPSQTGKSGNALITDGTNVSWGIPAALLPAFTSVPPTGMVLSNNVSDATNDIDISSGYCISDDGTTLMTLTALTKRLDANWTVGTNQGGLDTGVIANGTYHVWAITRTDTGVTDVIFSLSATTPNFPTSYTKKKCLGSIVRVAGSILSFIQDKNRFWLKTSVGDVSANNPGTAAVTRTLASIPTGAKFLADLAIHVYDAAALNIAALITDLDGVDETPVNYTGVGNTNSDNPTSASSGTIVGAQTGLKFVRTNTSAQVRSRLSSSSANTTLVIRTRGWIDPRL